MPLLSLKAYAAGAYAIEEIMSSWEDIDEYVLLGIFKLIKTDDLQNAGNVCRRWIHL